jgi:hypothetical protein
MRRVNKESHGVSRDYRLARDPLLIGDYSMRKSLDEATRLDLHGLANLNYEAVLGDINFDDFPILGLAVKSSLRVRPLDLIAPLISIEGWCEAGKHANILVPTCPLPSEVRITRIVMNKTAVHLWSISYSLRKEAFLK